MTNVISRDNCLLGCGEIAEIINLGLHAFADTFIPVDLVNETEPIAPLICCLCNSCGLVQLRSITVDFDRYNKYTYSYTSSNSSFARDHWKSLANKVLNSLDLKSSLVIEIGSNDGFLLKQVAPGVRKVLGVDSSEAMVAIANQNGVLSENHLFGEEVSNALIEGHGRADLVLANNVLNHANNPLDFVAGVKNLLSEKGVFIFEVPSWLSTIKSGNFDQIYHEHVTYFSVKSIKEVLEKVGLYIKNVEFVDYHGGSLRVSASKVMETENHIVVSQFIDEETKAGLYSIDTYKKYMKDLNIKKSKFLADFYQLKFSDPYLEFVGIGAAAKANTLLTYFGLNANNLNAVLDASPHKIGKFTPLTRIPIKDDDYVLEKENIVAIVLSWNISDLLKREITSRNPKVRFIDI
jgi:SAM-dependent methyltransferase